MKITTQLRVSKAQENYSIAQEIGGSSSAHRGWHATLLFYAALFWVRAYFEEAGIPDMPSHYKRLATLQRIEELSEIEEVFSDLQDISEDARYEMMEFSEERLRYAQAAYSRLYLHIWDLLEPEAPLPDVDEDDAH